MANWRLTNHALEQMTAMGVTREEVIDCLTHPLVRYEDRRGTVSANARLKVPHNPVTGEVITVLWKSVQWHPDRHQQPKEQPMGGWVNLDPREAETLLAQWGFKVAEEKQQSKLWQHPLDKEGRLVPFSIPSRGARANGKSSWRKVAQIVGVPVARFLQGVDEAALRKMELAYSESEVRTLGAIRSGPDPLGINSEVRAQRAAKVLQTLHTPTPPLVLTPTQEAALEAVRDEPLTAVEVGVLIERSKSVTHDTLAWLVKNGFVVTRRSKPGEGLDGRTSLYYAGGPGTEVPTRKQPETAAAEVDPLDLPRTAEEQQAQLEQFVEAVSGQPFVPYPEEPAVSCPDPSDIVIPRAPKESRSLGTVSTAPAQVYEDTGMPWPDGGVVLRDSEGHLWVAQRLVVGK